MCGELGLDLGTPKQSLDLLNQLKTLYKAKARKAKVDVSKQTHIIMYPEVPTAAMIRDCYDADDPPVASVSTSAGTLECLRRSSNKSKADQTALVPMSAGPAMQPPAMLGFAPNAMQHAQQAMALMGMDPMQAMMAMAARLFSQQGGQQSQQIQETPGLRIFAGSRGEVNLAAAPTPQASTPQGVAQAETPHGSPPGEDSQDLQLALPDTAQVVSPEEQAASVQLATQARQAAKATETPATKTPATKAKAKAKAKGKAKAKSQAKVEKEPAEANVSGATSSSKRKACDDDVDVAPSPKAKAKPAAKAKARAEKIVFTQENRPPCPEPKSGTTWYRKGKIHRNQGGFRVFVNASDRCDKKVKIKDENDCEAEWQKALKMIDFDDSYEGIPNVD